MPDMRLLYVAVAIFSAFTGYVALEAKPIEAHSKAKSARSVQQAKEIVTRQADYYEPEPTYTQVNAYAAQKPCCQGNTSCANHSCRTGNSRCSGKSCGCGK